MQGMDTLLLPIGKHMPAQAGPNDIVDETASCVPCGEDSVISLIGQSISIGPILQSFAGELFLPLRVPAVSSVSADGHHAITALLS